LSTHVGNLEAHRDPPKLDTLRTALLRAGKLDRTHSPLGAGVHRPPAGRESPGRSPDAEFLGAWPWQSGAGCLFAVFFFDPTERQRMAAPRLRWSGHMFPRAFTGARSEYKNEAGSKGARTADDGGRGCGWLADRSRATEEIAALDGGRPRRVPWAGGLPHGHREAAPGPCTGWGQDNATAPVIFRWVLGGPKGC